MQNVPKDLGKVTNYKFNQDPLMKPSTSQPNFHYPPPKSNQVPNEIQSMFAQ